MKRENVKRIEQLVSMIAFALAAVTAMLLGRLVFGLLNP